MPDAPKHACTDRVMRALREMRERAASAAVHVGAGNAVDMIQVHATLTRMRPLTYGTAHPM